jgi:hypothetical protein
MQTAEFVELLAVPQAQAKNPLFDIIIEGKVNTQNYCNALIAKILELKQSQFPLFIDYQFKDNKDLILKPNPNFVQLRKQGISSFTKYLFYADPGNQIQTFVYNSSSSLVATTEKSPQGITGSNFKIYIYTLVNYNISWYNTREFYFVSSNKVCCPISSIIFKFSKSVSFS